MQNLSVRLQANGEKALFYLKGVFDEDSDFQQLKFSPFKDITLDLKEVERINSRGLRKWITWLNGADRSKSFAIVNCPKVLVTQANMVKGVIPRWIRVMSVELPFYCEACQNPFSAPFNLPNERKIPIDVTSSASCTLCHKAAEVDADVKSYFRFLEYSE